MMMMMIWALGRRNKEVIWRPYRLKMEDHLKIRKILRRGCLAISVNNVEEKSAAISEQSSRSSFRLGEVLPKRLARFWFRCRQEMSTCATVRSSPQREQRGLSSPHSRYRWVAKVWPIRRRQSATSSLLEVLSDDGQAARRGLMSFRLEDPSLSQLACHFKRIWDEQTAKKSIAGSGKKRVHCLREARFAHSSARSFPTIPTWLGIQQKVTEM